MHDKSGFRGVRVAGFRRPAEPLTCPRAQVSPRYIPGSQSVDVAAPSIKRAHNKTTPRLCKAACGAAGNRSCGTLSHERLQVSKVDGEVWYDGRLIFRENLRLGIAPRVAIAQVASCHSCLQDVGEKFEMSGCMGLASMTPLCSQALRIRTGQPHKLPGRALKRSGLRGVNT